MEHVTIPTVRVAADTASGYRIINVSDHDPEAHEPWPAAEPEPTPPEPKRPSNRKA